MWHQSPISTPNVNVERKLFSFPEGKKTDSAAPEETALVLMKLNGEEESTLSCQETSGEEAATLRLCKLQTHLRVKPIDQNMGDGVFGIKVPNIRGG